MTFVSAVNAALLAIGAAMLAIAAYRVQGLVGLRQRTSHARVWQLLGWLMVVFVFGYLAALTAVVSQRGDLLEWVTAGVFFAGAGFVLVVTVASERTLRALIGSSLSHRQLSQILDSLGEAVVLIDRHGNIQTSNHTLSVLVGMTREALAGQSASEILGLELPLETSPTSMPPKSREHLLTRPMQPPIPILVTFTRVNDHGLLCILSDVRDAQRERQRLQDAVQVAEEILRVRNEFMELVAAELREPVTALETVQRQAVHASSRLEFLAVAAKVQSVSQTLTRSIAGLRDIAHLGGSHLALEPFSPPQLLASLASEISATQAARDLDIAIEVERGVPAKFYSHTTRLREILRMLANLAIARSPGGGRIHLTVGVVPGESTRTKLLFGVRDDGPQFASESSIREFLLPESDPASQTTIDLLVCRLLALSLGGQLSLANTTDKTVTMYLTVQGQPEATGTLRRRQPEGQSSQPWTPWGSPSLGGDTTTRTSPHGRVLVVEDNPATRALLTQQLSLSGHSIHAVATIREALQQIGEAPPDVILLDVLLPDGSGIDLLAELRRRKALDHLAVIMLSTLDESATITACLEGGAEDYLPKNISPVVLRARMASSIEKMRLRARMREQMALLATEGRRASDLLRVLLPTVVADELQATGTIVPRRHESVAVVFSDIVGFTAYCDRHPPEQVLASLQQLFTRFETLAMDHGVLKIKTIGDSFMGAVGLFTADPRPARACVALGHAMLAAIAKHPAGWQLRIGIHVGPVVGGIAGERQFLYDIWGDTVNTAQRIESAGTPGFVCISSAAKAQIEPEIATERLAIVEIKGKGPLEIFKALPPAGPRP